MKKPSTSEPDIVIEWRCARAGDAANFGMSELAREEVIHLARALGRLAARRDLEAARNAGECLSSASMQGTMSELEPT